ncbi:MAG: hypothetical protein HY685_02190 [Chloroflexi bacterium]|nr:hypothetical protein [Chloroflexota bacterium]
MSPLRIFMLLWTAAALATGLPAMLLPGLLVQLFGAPAQSTLLLGSWGWLVVLSGLGVGLAARDPLRNILWVKVAILGFVVGAAYDLAHLLAGTVTLLAVAPEVAVYGLFAILFLRFYPRGPRLAPLNTRSPWGPLYTDIDHGGLFVKRGRLFAPYFLPLGKEEQK